MDLLAQELPRLRFNNNQVRRSQKITLCEWPVWAHPVSETVETGSNTVNSRSRSLYARVRKALLMVPGAFRCPLTITGIPFNNLFSFNGPVGSIIEYDVVRTLNNLRDVWDDGSLSDFKFERQEQVFPDVLLTNGDRILIGVELKGWFLLAKEGEPSFRYKVSPLACAEHDILAVFPWHFSSITEGTPVLSKPFMVNARNAATLRNLYWTEDRGVTDDAAKLHLANAAGPYPKKGAQYNDSAQDDRGQNFGRLARSRRGQFHSFVKRKMNETIGDKTAAEWIAGMKIERPA